MECSSCGKPVVAGDRFCTNCGSRIDPIRTGQTIQSTAGTGFTGSEYIIEQKILAMRDTFGIKDRDGNLIAYAKRKIVSWGPQFWFESSDGSRLGEMRGKVLTVRPTFEIYDSQGLVAVVKKKMLKLLGSEWWLEDNSGIAIARIKGNIVEHDFIIQSSSGSQIAQVHKKWISVRDSYGIEIFSHDIAPYIIVAYVIALDHAEWKVGKGLAIGIGGATMGGMMNDFGTKS